MLLLSWNVAGLTTTVKRVETHYQSLGNFWSLHHADICCIQEHKIPRATLANRSDPRILLCGSNNNNKTAQKKILYESYWSCCTDANKKGFNGVVTYVAKGAPPVLAASSTPLGVPHLDQQGRCIMTDHGVFVLFNVYAPCSSIRGGYQLDVKLEFLAALRRAMQRERRENNKAVILVGDLNISLDKHDVYRKNRVVYVDQVLAKQDDPAMPQWQRDIREHWATIERILATKEAVATQTTNSMTGATYDKFRVVVNVPFGENNAASKLVYLGQHETSAEYALRQYDFSACSCTDPETGECVVACEANAIRVGILIELFQKLVVTKPCWDATTIEEITEHAVVEQSSPTRRWLRAVLEEDGMVDTFRHYYPHAKDRFTCWNQNKNCRYSNEGARIDYILIDQSLLPSLRQGNANTLRCGGPVLGDGADEQSPAAALQAVTANGRFQPAGYEGGGMNEASKPTLDTQFGEAHTGHVYTPPTFSDHIGVSALLETPECASVSTDASEYKVSSATRKSQPHRQQQSIASFFQKGPTKTSVVSTKKAVKKKQPKPAKKTLLDHFRKR